MRRMRDIVARSPALHRAALFPEIAGLRGLRLTDGLLRAPPRGSTPSPCLSAVLLDPPPRSAAERLAPAAILAVRGWEEAALLARAAEARRALVAARVGGAWWEADPAGELPEDNCVVVALDEPAVAGCGPHVGGGIAAAMLDAARAESPADRIVVLAPRRRFTAAVGAVRIVRRPMGPWRVLERARRVYSAGGELGFLALLAGVPVVSFAAAFYTGWGVTEDAPGVPQRPFRRGLDEIFAGACLVATRCRDPFNDRATAFENVLAILADWRRIEEANRRIAVCVGMSFWKRRRIAEFVRSASGVPAFRRSVVGALAAATRPVPPRAIAGWASRLPDGLESAAARHALPLIRVEDGFLRSVGLGSDFLPPASLVFDTRGMYFDPRGTSDLEILLRDTEFPPVLRARAQRLAAQLVARGITKYNLAGRAAGLQLPPDRRRILVPGQVEDDLSIRFGAAAVRTNLALLAEVRTANPDAFILYKPHPDVLAGHRKGAVAEAEARRFADAIVTDRAIPALLAVADELHTMTSLAGFEALLRGRRVVVYGRPFYAGWGLTDDRPPYARGRRLALDELVAGVLILYPRYLDPLTRLPCGPEVVVERLDRPELWRPGPLVVARRVQGLLARRLAEARAVLSGSGPAGSRALRERPRS